MSWCREAAAALTLLAAAQAGAAEWVSGGYLSARGEAATNPTLAVPAGEGARKLSLGAELTLTGRAEDWDASLSGGATRHLSNLSALQTTDGALNLRLARRFETDSGSASAGYRRDSTQASEAATTGLVLTRAQRDNYFGTLGWRHSFDERLSLISTASASAMRYDRAAVRTLIDTDSASVSAGVAYALRPRTSLSLTGNASATDTNPFTSRTRTSGFQVGANHEVSDRLNLNVSYGPSRTRLESAGLVPICPVPQFFCDAGIVRFALLPAHTVQMIHGKTYNAALVWQAGLRTSLSFSGGRSINASGSGVPAQTDSASALLSHQLGEHLNLLADAVFTSADSLGGLIASKTRSRRYSATLSWQLDRDWSLDGGFRLTRYELPGGLAPRSDAIFVGLRYQLRERRL